MSRVITIVLTPEQESALKPLALEGVKTHKALLLCTTAPHLFPPGLVEWRLQAILLPWYKANKILKIITQ